MYLVLSLFLLIQTILGWSPIIVPINDRKKHFAPPTLSQKIKYTIGAQVLVRPVNVYMIYYGDFDESQQSIINEFVSTLDQSEWWQIMKKYYYQETEYSERVHVNGQVTLVKTIHDDYSRGTFLQNEDIPNIIRSHVDSLNLPQDPDGVYYLLSSSNVDEEMSLANLGMFCSDYCGYHFASNFTSGGRFPYMFVGNPMNCLSQCSGPNTFYSPNGDVGMDSMASTIAHEMAEVVSDPEPFESRAWDGGPGPKEGFENGDMCAYSFGKTKRDLETKSLYNYENIHGKKFLIQQNWDPELNRCVSRA